MIAQLAPSPADRVEIVSVVDNVFDLLLMSTDVARRLGPGTPDGLRMPLVGAPLLESGECMDPPVAEHGLSLLISVTSGGTCRTLLFDTGSSVGALAHNLRALNVDPTAIEAIVLSHGHFDHTMGLNGLVEILRPLPPLVVHPDIWLRRRVAIPGRDPWELPTMSREKICAAGFPVIEARHPSSILGGGIVVTGEIERTTEFEHGLPVHQAFRDGEWQSDPLLQDDQALVANVRGKGLVVITGCGHAGVVNTVRYACKITGVDRVYAILGGFHLSGLFYEPIIPPTVEALREIGPEVIAPCHCTGWRAVHALADAFPNGFIPSSVGTRYVLEAGKE
jgi:7,8-dihydropterin-6-yl-methyl-4-(beta-D-ribofuranosyl)aminobenzene 5'-phosphate synthase